MSGASNLAWCTRGSVVVGAIGAVVVFVGGPSIIAPVPVYLLLLAWTISFLAVLVLPTIYFLSAYYGSRVRSYAIWLFAVVLVIAGLDVWYLTEAWAFGVKWQGIQYAKVTVGLNILSLGTVSVIAGWGALKNSTRATQIAHLGLFVVLSWCAFPVLGELP